MNIDELTVRANNGDASAMWELAESYFWSNDIENDEEKAVKTFDLYKQIERLDPSNVDVFSRIANCYANGLGTSKNLTMGFNYYQRAAVKGSKFAYYGLAEYYKSGNLVAQNIPLAIDYLKKGIELNHAQSMIMLGDMYHSGDCVEKDDSQAVALYKKAADLGDGNACYRLAMQTYNGWGVPADEQLGIEYWKKGAEIGHRGCQLIIGMFYKNGDGVPAIPQDIEKAIYWFERSVEHGLVDAHWELAKIYASGAEGIPADMEKAVSHLTVVAESDNKNNIEAMRALGSYYMDHGKGKDINLAFQWYDRAAKLGDFSSVHLATLTKSAIVPASLMAANHLNYMEAWERALEDCQECQRCIAREEGYINSGEYRVDQEWLNSLAKHREDNAYDMAECLFNLKRYEEVYDKLRQSKSLKARILSTAAALCGSLRVSRGDLYQAVKELETNTTYDPQVEGSYVGEQAYAASMLFIANLHRDCGGRDLEISVNVLELAISILKDKQLKAALTDERRHYQPKLFGGYKYV